MIDEEVKKIVDLQYARAKDIIITHRTALDKIAEALLEHETIDGIHVQEIVDHGEMRTPVRLPDPPPLPEAKPDAKTPAAAPQAEPEAMGGSPAPSPA